MQQTKRLFNKLTEDEARLLVNKSNPSCPFHNFVGNNDSIESLLDYAYNSLLSEDRACQGAGIALYGLHGMGKTTVAKLFAEVLELPFLSIQASEIVSTDYLLERIEAVLEEAYLYLTPMGDTNGKEYYEIPPMVIFIDEVHSLPQASKIKLLSALEKNTSLLITSKADLSCKNIYWVVATTDRGQLSLPFDSRFISIRLHPYTTDEVAQIIHVHTGWDMKVCSYITKFVKMPRQAINFAQEVDFAAKRANINLYEATDKVAVRNGIDESGLDKTQISVMMALYGRSDTGLSSRNLANVACVNVEELSLHVMPLLLMENKERKALVYVSSRYHITEAGTYFLKQRGLI